MRITPFYSKVSLAAAMFVGFFAFTTAAPVVRADDCQERMVKIDHKLHEAIEHHGSQSSQASTGDTNCMRSGNAATPLIIAGGARTIIAGTPIVLGMTTITTTRKTQA